jgi:hypothetical protein
LNGSLVIRLGGVPGHFLGKPLACHQEEAEQYNFGFHEVYGKKGGWV